MVACHPIAFRSEAGRESAPTHKLAHGTLTYARMDAEMQGCNDSARVSSLARPVDSHTSASAQNGETDSLEPSKRSGAATRLNMDDVVMTASPEASFSSGLAAAAAPPGGESVAFEGIPAQNMPRTAPET